MLAPMSSPQPVTAPVSSSLWSAFLPLLPFMAIVFAYGAQIA